MKQHLYVPWFYGHYSFPDKGSDKKGRWVYNKDKVRIHEEGRTFEVCAICCWEQRHPYHQ